MTTTRKYPGKYNFPLHRRGDTMKKKTFPITVNGVALDLTGATVAMDVRDTRAKHKYKHHVRYELEDGFEINEDGNLVFTQKIIDIPGGTHAYDIEIVLANGYKLTYLAGSFPVEDDITHER